MPWAGLVVIVLAAGLIGFGLGRRKERATTLACAEALGACASIVVDTAHQAERSLRSRRSLRELSPEPSLTPPWEWDCQRPPSEDPRQ
jgi:hypothetical protein